MCRASGARAEPAARGAHHDLGRGGPPRQRPARRAPLGRGAARCGCRSIAAISGTSGPPTACRGTSSPTWAETWSQAGKNDEINAIFDQPYADAPSDEDPRRAPGDRARRPASAISTFELDLAAAQAHWFEGDGQAIEAFFSAAEPVALVRIARTGGADASGVRGPGRPREARLRRPPRWAGEGGRAVVRPGGGRRPAVLRLRRVARERRRDAPRRHGHLDPRRRPIRWRSPSARPAARSSRATTRASSRTPRGGRSFWSESRGPMPERGDPAALLPGAVLLRRRLAARRAADAAAGRVDGRRGRPAAVEGRLPQRPRTRR